MRDDVKRIIAELTIPYREKLNSLKKLLLSESDKLHYIKTQNLEKILEIIETDKAIIEEIDTADSRTSGIENDLAKIIGSDKKGIFSRLNSEKNEIKEIVSLRNEIRKMIELLFGKRKLLMKAMTAESLQLKERINEISRISALKYHYSA